MLRKWLTKKLSIHDDDPVVKEFRKKGYIRRHTVDVDSFRMTSSTQMAPSGGGEEQTDQEMMAAALAKHSKSYDDQRIGGPYRRHKSVASPLGVSSPLAGLSPTLSGMVRRSASGGLLRPRLTTVPSTDCPPGADGGQNDDGDVEVEGEGARVLEATDPSAGSGSGDGNDAKLEEANDEGLAIEVKETKIDIEGTGTGGARTKTGAGGGRGGGGGGRSGGRGRGSSVPRFRKAGLSKSVGCSGCSSSSGSFKRRSLRRGIVKQNGLKVDTSQPLVFPTTPETILEYHKQKPILDENEEWLVVELNEFECLVDSLDVLRIIAKHSKFFEVSPDELWEEFFEFVDTVPSYDEVINFDVWQEFRDKKYTC